MNKLTIGLIGIAGAGKDTIASYLSESLLNNHYLPSSIYRFATSLKHSANQLFGSDFDQREIKEVPQEIFITDESLHQSFGILDLLPILQSALANQDIPAHYCSRSFGLYAYLSPAKYQQIMGTEVLRTINHNYHVDRFLNETNLLPTLITIAPDTRFLNECKICDILIFVHTNKESQRPDHPSEKLAQELVKYKEHSGYRSTLLDDFFKLNALILCVDNSLTPTGEYKIKDKDNQSIRMLANQAVMELEAKKEFNKQEKKGINND